MSEPVSALAHLYAPVEDPVAAPEPLIALADGGMVGQITLKADLGDPAVTKALEGAGLTLPGPLSVVEAGGARVVWMAPDEVLILLAEGAGVAPVLSALESGLSGVHHLVLNVSDTRAVLRLTGARAGEVLAKGAPCDCSDLGFPPGTARRTHLAGLAVGIWRLDAETWEAVCFRSYAHHLHAWLEQASVPGSEVDWR